jgi:hypothetical protein
MLGVTDTMQESNRMEQNTHKEVGAVITEAEFRRLHLLLAVIVEQELGTLSLLPEEVVKTVARKDSAVSEQPASEPLVQWIALLDMAISPHLLRNFVQDRNPDEETLRALVRFLVSKQFHSQADRDKVDWLATQLFRRQKEKKQKGAPTGWPKQATDELLRGLHFPPLSRRAEELLAEFPALLDEVKEFARFNQITDSRILERSRDVKNLFGDEFFHPEVLAAAINYNLLFGKQFEGLLEDLTEKVRKFGQGQPQHGPSELKEMLQSDYRTTGGALRNLSELEQEAKEPAKQASPVLTPSQLADKQPMELAGMGIDVSRNVERLRNKIHEIVNRLRYNPQLTSIPEPGGKLLLSEWELSALRAEFPDSEESFRAAFARGVCHAIGILSRISEELPAYHETKGSDYHWKQHCDALIYLLCEGRQHKEALQKLAADCQKRGLHDKSKQILSTTEKLGASLTKVAALF